MSLLSQVSAPERRGAAQARMVAPKAVSARVLYGPLRRVLAKLREQLNSSGNKHHARIRRPPQNRLLRRVPGEHAALIGGQQPRRPEVAARREQPGRLAQGVLQRRKPVRISLFAQPDQSAQSCNSSSGTRW